MTVVAASPESSSTPRSAYDHTLWDGFVQPDSDLVAELDVEPLPQVSVASTGTAMALLKSALPSISDYGRTGIRIGQWRIDLECPAHPEPPPFRAVGFIRVADDARTDAVLPPNRGIWPLGFSPDASRFALMVILRSSVHLATVHIQDATTHLHDEFCLNARLLLPLSDRHVCRWFADGKRLLCRSLVPRDRGSPREPTWLSTTTSGARTSPRQLIAALDATQLESYCQSELVVVDVETNGVRRLEISGLIADARPSPNGRYVSVACLRFVTEPDAAGLVRPSLHTTVWDISHADRGAQQMRQLTEVRLVHWAAGSPSRLVWVARADGAQGMSGEAFCWCDAPFLGADRTLSVGDGTYTALRWTSAGRLIASLGGDTPRTFVLDLESGTSPRVQSLPIAAGDVLLTSDAAGDAEVVEHDEAIFVTVDRWSPACATSRVDRIDVQTGRRATVFAHDSDHYERCVGMVGTSRDSFLVAREGPDVVPRLEAVAISDARRRCLVAAADRLSPFSRYPRRPLQCQRADGVSLSSMLHLPARAGGDRDLLPAVFCVYAQPGGNPAVTGPGGASMNQYPFGIGASPSLLFLRGYAVLVNLSLPLVCGNGVAMDRFVEQMVMSAEASVRALIETSVVDPDRIGIYGRSYGAFVVATLLAHTRLFRAGIARSGAYNRATTPFGYQNERRAYWEAAATYAMVSPLAAADRIKAPLLLIHGDWDDHDATSPTESQHLFEALRRLGTPTRYVHLPREGHLRGSLEGVRHAAAETLAWCDRYLRGPIDRPAPVAAREG